jgi:dolichol-phosphate mannosyltransferase
MVNEKRQIEISVVIPVYNEDECIVKTLQEVTNVMRKIDRKWELLAVDDGSTDNTPKILKNLSIDMPELRVLTLVPNAGQSAAFGVGFRHAAGRTIITMDADGQNDPADIPELLKALDKYDCCFGYRANRQDTFSKRIGSKIGNGIRNWVLKENIIDTGCSLKAFPKDLAQNITMWTGMHRFLGSMLAMQEATIKQIPVNHRPRELGTSKYTNFGRFKKTIWDLLAVRWMKKRCPHFKVVDNQC